MIRSRLFSAAIFISLAWLMTDGSDAAAVAAEPDSLVLIKMKDTNVIKGRIVAESDESIEVETPAGLRIDIPREAIISVDRFHDRLVEGKIRGTDPNYTRLMFAPTGRPLRKGDGYFSDYYILFPGISYGLTDYFSFMAGFSFIPGQGLSEQMRYVAPRFSRQFSDGLALSVGTLYMSVAGEFSAGIAFAVGTIGPPEKSLTAGLGLGYIRGENDGTRFAEDPILMLGGNLNISDNLALISENWLIVGTELKYLPFGVAVRFFGQHIAADVGVILIGEILKEGFPIPWLSFVYNFGGAD